MNDMRKVTIVAGQRLDALRAVSLRREIDTAIEDGLREITVDLTDTEFTDSVGLAAVVYGRLRLSRLGGDLVLLRPRNEEAWRLFELTSFNDVFTIGQKQ